MENTTRQRSTRHTSKGARLDGEAGSPLHYRRVPSPLPRRSQAAGKRSLRLPLLRGIGCQTLGNSKLRHCSHCHRIIYLITLLQSLQPSGNLLPSVEKANYMLTLNQETDIAKQLGSAIRKTRETKKFSQRKLAQLTEMSQGHLSLVECGLRMPSATLLAKLNAVLKSRLRVDAKVRLR